jgi:hypothetical protein
VNVVPDRIRKEHLSTSPSGLIANEPTGVEAAADLYDTWRREKEARQRDMMHRRFLPILDGRQCRVREGDGRKEQQLIGTKGKRLLENRRRWDLF